MEFDGYREAEKIDDIFNKLLKRYPITKENALEWMKLCRTISTTCHILTGDSKEELGLKMGDII